jgi:hypothetical protein
MKNTTPRNNGVIKGLSLGVPTNGARNQLIERRGNVSVDGFPIGPPRPKKQYPGIGLLTLQTLLKRTPKRYIKKVLANTLTGKEVREMSALKKSKLTNAVRRSIRPKKKKV